jgi:hypothetical protein
MDTIIVEYTRKFDELVKSIMEYESDTFSAERSEITLDEAIEIADKFVCHKIQGLIDTHTMDGVMIDEELAEIRDR